MLLSGLGGGVMWCIIFSSYGLAFWYGVHLIMADRQACLDDVGRCLVRYDSASLLVVFLSVLMGTSTGKEVVHLEFAPEVDMNLCIGLS